MKGAEIVYGPVTRREAIHNHYWGETCTKKCGAFEVDGPVDASVYRNGVVEWAGSILTADVLGTALAHEGIEPSDDALENIAGDLRLRLWRAYTA